MSKFKVLKWRTQEKELDINNNSIKLKRGIRGLIYYQK